MILQGLLDGLKPSPILTVSEWADRNRELSPLASSEPGQWRTSRTPYLKKIMDCLSVHSGYKKIIVEKGAQLGFTEAGNNWIGYIIDNCPAPTLMVLSTDETVRRNSKTRVDPMIQASPNLRTKVHEYKANSGENTITQKNFPGGILIMTGANSSSGLRSMPIKNLFLDEVDDYPIDVNEQGSPIELAEVRTNTFANRKVFIISTPTIKGCSAVDDEISETDKNKFSVPCPFCGAYHFLEFSNLRWNKGDYANVKMKCPNCGELIDEHYKTSMLAAGKWIPTDTEKINGDTIGFIISSLYSPFGWFSWASAAREYDKAAEDPNKMKVFVNTVLGEPFEESGEAPAWHNLYNRRELYAQNSVNDNVVMLTCGVDIQKDRIELEVVGWCLDKSSYSIDYRVLLGNTTLPDVWHQLDDVLHETWTKDNGSEIAICKMAVDSGYNTTEVHDFCRQRPGLAIPIKGQPSLGLPVSPPKQIDYSRNGKKIGRLKQWNVGVNKLKAELYSWLNIEPISDKENNIIYPPCYCHFPQYAQNYFEGLTAEQWIEKRQLWVKKYERNEPLDCRIYARAASVVMGLDRMSSSANITKTASKEAKKPKKSEDDPWGSSDFTHYWD